jgi:hypothetical protein
MGFPDALLFTDLEKENADLLLAMLDLRSGKNFVRAIIRDIG